MARDDFATFEYIMFISVFNVKTKVTVYIYLKLLQPRATQQSHCVVILSVKKKHHTTKQG